MFIYFFDVVIYGLGDQVLRFTAEGSGWSMEKSSLENLDLISLLFSCTIVIC